jgi:transcriptional regulator with XRE-family HTH domain
VSTWEELLQDVLIRRKWTLRALVDSMGAEHAHVGLEQSIAPMDATGFICLARKLHLDDREASDLVEAATAAKLLEPPGVDEDSSVGAHVWGTAAIAFFALLGDMPQRGQLDAEARLVLTRLHKTLGLTQEDIASMLDVTSAAVVAELQSGRRPVPILVVAQLREWDTALDKLESIFLPERLASLIRRPAEIFDGASAIELIREGRLTEVAARYDRAFQYAR